MKQKQHASRPFMYMTILRTKYYINHVIKVVNKARDGEEVYVWCRLNA